jgi:hypothetical protein
MFMHGKYSPVLLINFINFITQNMHLGLAEYLEFFHKFSLYMENKLLALMPTEVHVEVVKEWTKYLAKAYPKLIRDFGTMDENGDGLLSKAEAMADL